jgi:hypothetical protein
VATANAITEQVASGVNQTPLQTMPNRMEIDIRTIQIWIELNSREQGKRGKATIRVTLGHLEQ